MSLRSKETFAAATFALLLVGAFLSVRARHQAAPARQAASTEAAPQSTASAQDVTQDEAVEIAGTFAQAVGWKPEGDLKIEFRPDDGTYGPAWDVSWLGPGRDLTVGVDSQTGQIARAMNYYEGEALRQVGAPAVSSSVAQDAGTNFVQASGLPSDARLSGTQYKVFARDPGRNLEQGEYLVQFGRYFGDAKYKDDGITVRVDAATGKVAGIRCRWAMQPPPDVPRNITQSQAIELGKKYLTETAVAGSAPKIHGLNKVELAVVQPRDAHRGEPSRIAWVVEFSRAEVMPNGTVDTSHLAEAWIDVEDGSFLGSLACD